MTGDRGAARRRAAPLARADPEGVIEAREVRARRLVITDADGGERIVGHVLGTHAEVRVALADSTPGEESMVVITAGEDPDLGSVLAIDLLALGNHLAGLQAWQEHPGGPWRAEIRSRYPDPDAFR